MQQSYDDNSKYFVELDRSYTSVVKLGDGKLNKVEGKWTIVVDLHDGRDVISLKWIYKTKYNEDGLIQKHKACLVTKGYAQQTRVDFHDKIAPIIRMETIRTFLALVAQMELQVF